MPFDPTETIRKERVAEINSGDTTRTALETQHGQVWDTKEMQQDFTPMGFGAPLIVVIRKADGVKGSLEFAHSPRFYFSFIPHISHIS